MNIDWAALGSVALVSLVVTVGLVGFFTLGIVGLSRQDAATGGGPALSARVGAYTCFAVCVAAVVYGIFLIVV